MSTRTRDLSLTDHFIRHLDQTFRTLFAEPAGSGRPNPSEPVQDGDCSAVDKAESICMMRVNHAGEVCAQALYQGQALTARKNEVRTQMQQAANEENDHLAWCRQRLDELSGYTSLLNPLWYAGSFLIGTATGALGDKWSLGFLAETEHQVEEHLAGHLRRLPANDNKSRAILEQMKTDEAKHRKTALKSGGAALPDPAKKLMTLMSRVMTTMAYRI